MSGMAAIYAFHGASCDRALLASMGQALFPRGDALTLWADGSVGLAMARRSEKRMDALSFRCQASTYHLAADARLDGRGALIATLHAHHIPLPTKTDMELIAASYDLWGDACVEHLQGDYAFVLWDSERKRLFAARCPLGLRPLVYHVNAQRFLCASTPHQLLVDPSIARDLDATWIAFWLLGGLNHWEHTAFREIRPLAAGHTLVVDATGLHITPYWQPHPRPRLTYPSQHDYSEHFRALFCEAVRDRTRPEDGRALFDLSGGLDSSSLVCLAAELRQQEQSAAPIVALHAYSPTCSEKDDRAYARLVAERYGVDLRLLSYEDYPVGAGLSSPGPWTSAPAIPTLFFAPLYQEEWRLAAELGARGHIHGDFGDQLLSASPTYLTALWNERRYIEFLRELMRWRTVPEVSWSSLCSRTLVRPYLVRRRQSRVPNPAPWVSPSVWARYEQQRQQDEANLRQIAPDPLARRLFQWIRRHNDYLPAHEEILAAGLEVREPYTDLRLIEFLLACPAQDQMRPGVSKFLLREAMRGRLPEPIRTRRDKGRIARLLFRGIAEQHKALRELIGHLPDAIRPYLDSTKLLLVLDRVALGDDVNQVTFLSALALVIWAHRLPWAGGELALTSSIIHPSAQEGR
jgi:asparagine synthase (glutamine-hydrolysing)